MAPTLSALQFKSGEKVALLTSQTQFKGLLYRSCQLVFINTAFKVGPSYPDQPVSEEQIESGSKQESSKLE